MTSTPTWELIGVAILLVLVFFLYRGGFRRVFEESARAEKDWPAFLWPVALVIAFVVLLIVSVS
ncbi:MAG: hypothetical protein LJE84_04470 [Gammaproteobacteria bacterium]|jgi:hypothetical protein|nr:hypothetical protein [Gammaproteobacteria bacterium]